MSKVVVDTDVVSFLFKNSPNAEFYRPHLVGKIPVLSFMTVAELDQWALERNWGEARRYQMAEYMRKFVVVPFTRSLCLKWAEVSVQRRKKGRPIQCPDAWIAATALLYNLPLITNNRKDYEEIDGLALISEPEE